MEDCAVAIVTDNLTYETSYQPFERPPDNQSLYSLIPRGVRRFFIQTDTQAKPVNDQIDMFVTATLPENFAYIFRSFTFQLEVDTASDWDGEVMLRLFNHIPGQPLGTAEHILILWSLLTGSGNVVPTQTVRGNQVDLSQFTGPMWAVHGGSITVRVSGHNTAAAVQAAGFIFGHMEFLVYDLTQAQRYYVNTPIPTLAR